MTVTLHLLFRDSYSSPKIIRRKYLRAKIELLEGKKFRSGADVAELKALEKELGSIEDFLGDARKQRDAILEEIGLFSL